MDGVRGVGRYPRRVGGLEHIGSGKVRELYAVDDDRLLIVATDRISAFDVVLDQPIPHKGAVLTGLTLFWLDALDTPNHLISTDEVPEDFAGRAMLVRIRCVPARRGTGARRKQICS